MHDVRVQWSRRVAVETQNANGHLGSAAFARDDCSPQSKSGALQPRTQKNTERSSIRPAKTNEKKENKEKKDETICGTSSL